MATKSKQDLYEALQSLWAEVVIAGEPCSSIPGRELEPGEIGESTCALCGYPEFLDCPEDCEAGRALITLNKFPLKKGN